MFEKIDNFAMQWLETAKSGLTPISEATQAAAEFVFNLFWAIMALLIMVFAFPLWLLGKVCAEQSVQLTTLRRGLAVSIFINVILLAVVLFTIGGN